MQNPTNGIKALQIYLGAEYSVKAIDREFCIYRGINGKYEIEVSGADHSKNAVKMDIYVWQIRPNIQIVEKIFGIRSREKLKVILQQLSYKYQSLSQTD